MNVLWRRAGIAAVAATAFLGMASPAFAVTPADLAVTIDSSVIAEGSTGKEFIAKVRNAGETQTVGLVAVFDTSGLKPAKLAAPTSPDPSCVVAATNVTCTYEDVLIAPGATIEVPLTLKPVAGQTGDAGSLSVTVSSAGAPTDTGPNNTAKVEKIMIEGSGADLVVVAFDVYELDADDIPVGPVKPGNEAKLFVFVGNLGDKAATKWKVTTVLPEHVSFASRDEDLCEYSADGKTEACTLSGEEWELGPGDAFGGDFHNPVKVAADAPGPVNLTTGTVTVEVLEEKEPPDVAPEAARTGKLTTKDKAFDGVDPGDNVDGYTVFVGPKPTGGGGSLPITGARAGLIGGMGAAALVLGGVLFVLARRRRVVLEV